VIRLHAMDEYPVGQVWIFDIGVAQIEHRLQSDGRLHLRVLTGEHAGREETVALSTQLIRPGVFLVWWRESVGITVVHVEDFESRRFQSVATLPDGRIMHFSGAMWRMGAPAVIDRS